MGGCVCVCVCSVVIMESGPKCLDFDRSGRAIVYSGVFGRVV